MYPTYRLYTFVANHYLSQLQCGLQTAHVVSELAAYGLHAAHHKIFNAWAEHDKTIIICGAGNHAGVLECHESFKNAMLNGLEFLPLACFCEDEESMNRMATACGIIVPDVYYDAELDVNTGKWVHQVPGKEVTQFSEVEEQFIAYIKSFRLA